MGEWRVNLKAGVCRAFVDCVTSAARAGPRARRQRRRL